MSDDTHNLNYPPAPHRLASILSWARDGANDTTAAPMLDLADPEQADFGPFQLLELIGQGGMGLVYRARQKSLDRDVALKLISPLIEGVAGSRNHFHREARLAAALNHPNILPVLEVGEHGGVDYIAMPLARGETLAARCQAGAMPADAAVALLIPVCEAIDYAHRLGLLHLDLKPANILFDEHGAPLVADFGLARPMDANGQVLAQEVSGTPGFMAPEQVLIKDFRLSRATDVYALGAILFRMISGRSPHGAGDAKHVMQRVLAGEIEQIPSSIPVSADINAICAKAMSWRAEDRYDSARSLLEDLRRFSSGLDISVRRPRGLERVHRWVRRDPRMARMAGVVFAALVVSLVTMVWAWRTSVQERLTASVVLRSVFEADYERQERAMPELNLDEVVPIVPCRLAMNCPGSGSNTLFWIEEDLGADAVDTVVELLEAVPSDQRAAGAIVRDYRQIRSNTIGANHFEPIAEDGSPLALMVSGDFLVNTDLERLTGGPKYLAILAEEHPDSAIEGKQSLGERVLPLLGHLEDLRVAASLCAPQTDACRVLHEALQKRDPENAYSHLVAVPMPFNLKGWIGFDDRADASILRAAGTGLYRDGKLDLMADSRQLAKRVRARLPSDDGLDEEALATWISGVASGNVWTRVSAYCRYSALHRERPDFDRACLRVFELISAVPEPEQFIDSAMSSRCMQLHYLTAGAARDRVREEFRQLSWLEHVDEFGRDGKQFRRDRLDGTLKSGELAYLRSRAESQYLPVLAPHGFVALEPLPWRNAEGVRAIQPPSLLEPLAALTSNCG